MIALLFVASFYWLWFGLTQRSIDEDEGTSILAAQGVVQHGYPLLPSGYIYHRGYLPSYILAGSITLFGLNDFSIFLPSLLLGLGVLWITFLFSKKITASPWIGVGAVFLLIVLQIQTYSATSPRMYIYLQFFALLSFYSAFRWSENGKFKYFAASGFAALAAALSQRIGGALVLVLPLSLGAASWMTGKKLKTPLRVQHGIVWAFLAAGLVFLFFYSPPNAIQPIAIHGGNFPQTVGININFAHLSEFLYQLEKVFPLSFPLLVLIPLVLGKAILNRNFAVTYLFFIYFSSLLTVLLSLHISKTRYWMFIMPLCASIVCILVGEFIQAFRKTTPSFYSKTVLLLTAGGILLYLGFNAGVFSSHYRGHTPEAFRAAYGFPCQNEECHPQIKQDYKTLKPHIRPQDLVFSTNPWVTRYYLGQVDGFLREKKEGNGFSSFDHPRDEYLGIPLIDKVDELQESQKKGRNLWILLDYKKEEFLSEKTLDFIKNHFPLYHQDPFFSVYKK